MYGLQHVGQEILDELVGGRLVREHEMQIGEEFLTVMRIVANRVNDVIPTGGVHVKFGRSTGPAVARALNTSDEVSGRPRMFITSKMRCAPSRSSVVTMTSVTSLTRYCANCWRPASDQLEISSYVLRMLATILALRCGR